jgi:hypothetical protein
VYGRGRQRGHEELPVIAVKLNIDSKTGREHKQKKAQFGSIVANNGNPPFAMAVGR